MLKFVIFAAAAFFLYKMFVNDKKKKAEVRHKQEEAQAREGILVKDPICGTYVSKESEIRVKEGDKVHFFCSYECRDKYLDKAGK